MTATDQPFEGKAFQTAAARRRGVPIKFTVEDYRFNEEDDNAEPVHISHVLMVNPKLDVVRLGVAFAATAKAARELRGDDVDEETKVAIIERETPKIRTALRECLTPPSRLKWDEVAPAYSITETAEIIRWLTGELTGLDPTQRPSSTDGSDETSTPSTDGPPPEG